MKCIDAIEGTIKQVIKHLFFVYAEYNIDDSEFIRNVKAVIEGTDQFVSENQEIVSDPQVLKQVIYTFSKDLWLQHVKEMRRRMQQSYPPKTNIEEQADYDEYYYDYIYTYDTYPR